MIEALPLRLRADISGPHTWSTQGAVRAGRPDPPSITGKTTVEPSAQKRIRPCYPALFSSLKNSNILAACSLVGSPSPSVHPVSVSGETPMASATLAACWMMMSR